MISLRPACGRRSDARIRGFVVQSADQFYPVLACADALQGVSFVIAVLTGIAESPTSAGQPDPIVLIRQCVDTMAPLRCARVRSGPAGHRGAWLICSGSTSCSAQCVLRTSRNHGSRNGNRAGRSRASHRNITPGSTDGSIQSCVDDFRRQCDPYSFTRRSKAVADRLGARNLSVAQ